MIIGTATAGLAMSVGGMIATGLGLTANRAINKKSEYVIGEDVKNGLQNI